jgi:hypothetical protein
MATSSQSQAASPPAMAVSAKHLLACRASFASNVLPGFPASQARFERYFCDSYALIRSLPEDKSVSDISLAVLGVNGFAIAKPPLSGKLFTQLSLLHSLGLGYRPRESLDLEIYNPGIIGPALSAIFGDAVSRADAALARFEELNQHQPDVYTYHMLAWPSLLSPNAQYAEVTLGIGSLSVNCPVVPVKDGIETISPVLRSIVKNTAVMRAIANALLVVEQMRSSVQSVPANGVPYTELGNRLMD